MSTWNVICRAGPGDRHTPDLAADAPRLVVPIDQPGLPGEVVSGLLPLIRERTGRPVPPAAADLVTLAVAVYTADLRVARKYAEDRWTRDFVLHLPVSHPAAWKGARKGLQRMLGFLTGDRWDVEIRGRQEEVVQDPEELLPPDPPSAVSLFSGGLDSFVGAIDRLEAGGRVALVSHYGPGVTPKVQSTVFGKLAETYGDRAVHLRFRVHPPLGDKQEGEPTMRSRSLLFLALGTAVASACGDAVPLSVPENGLVSLNVPLTGTRLSSSSTRTTHPHFVALYGELLSALGLRTPVELPYHFKTKGEMLTEARNQAVVQAAAKLTMSCAHPEAGRHTRAAPSLHCGYCVPCLIRRAAMHAADAPDAPYRVDVLTDPPAHDLKSGRDLRAFLMALERSRDTPRQALRSHVLDAGPLPEGRFGAYADVYLRGMDELRRFLLPHETAR